MIVTRPGMQKPQILAMKRSAKASFMPNAVVFPGGIADQNDATAEWKKFLSSHHGKRKFKNLSESLIYPCQPEIYQTNSDQPLSNQISLRLTAIRELLEETGVFLGTNGVEQVSNEERQKIYKNPNTFVDFCKTKNSAPDIDRLREWSNWLTPNFILPKRFDTMFYLLSLTHEEKSIEFTPDNSEMLTAEWREASWYVKNQDQVHLHPPQGYEFSRLMNFETNKEIDWYARRRAETHGTKRWMPIVTKPQKFNGKNVRMNLMPDDFFYPEDNDVLGLGEQFEVDEETMMEQLGFGEIKFTEPENCADRLDRGYWWDKQTLYRAES